MNLVVNEWLLEYSIPSATKANKELVLAFLNHIKYKNEKMVVGRETPFTQKYYRFMKTYGYDLAFKRSFQTLLRLLFQDADTTILVERSDTKSVTDLEMDGVHADDRYLLELVRTVDDSIIISTDQRLIDRLMSRPGFPIIHLANYLSSCS